MNATVAWYTNAASVGELQRSQGLNELPTHEEELPPSVEVKISKSGKQMH